MKEQWRKMYFSQAALTAYQTCPLKFRYRYLDELYWLQAGCSASHGEERILGENFHLMVQRYFQKVTPDLISSSAPPGPLSKWLDCLRQKFPYSDDLRYYPEQELRVVIGDARFTAKYDLLIRCPDGRVIIYDWKTQADPVATRGRTLQTRVYSLVLCTAEPFGKLRPEEITAIFWNPRFPQDEQVWPYGEHLYRQDQAELTALAAKITDMSYQDFAGLQTGGGPPPKECRRCEYAALCNNDGQVYRQPMPAWQDFSWDNIEEIAYEEA